MDNISIERLIDIMFIVRTRRIVVIGTRVAGNGKEWRERRNQRAKHQIGIRAITSFVHRQEMAAQDLNHREEIHSQTREEENFVN